MARQAEAGRDQPVRPLPEPDELTRPFWEAASRHELVIQRCGACRRYHFPPVPLCSSCSSTDLRYEDVSGDATVYSYTETHAGARHPYFSAAAPYVVGLVELVEQEGLLMYTNFAGASLSQLHIDAPVHVEFGEEAIPQFRLVAATETHGSESR